jgi:hypothetical protein
LFRRNHGKAGHQRFPNFSQFGRGRFAFGVGVFRGGQGALETPDGLGNAVQRLWTHTLLLRAMERDGFLGERFDGQKVFVDAIFAPLLRLVEVALEQCAFLANFTRVETGTQHGQQCDGFLHTTTDEENWSYVRVCVRV